MARKRRGAAGSGARTRRTKQNEGSKSSPVAGTPSASRAQLSDLHDLVQHLNHASVELEKFTRGARSLGHPCGANFGTEGTTPREKAVSSALWMAYTALSMVSDVHKDEGFWILFPPERFVRAANVLRGGRIDSTGSYRLLLAIAGSPFVHSPRNSEDNGWLCEKLAECFGSAFSSVEHEAVGVELSKAFQRSDNLMKRWRDGDRVHPHQAMYRFARDVVWLAFEHARKRGEHADPTCFRFPMPTKPTKNNLLVAIQNYARAKRERERRSTD